MYHTLQHVLEMITIQFYLLFIMVQIEGALQWLQENKTRKTTKEENRIIWTPMSDYLDPYKSRRIPFCPYSQFNLIIPMHTFTLWSSMIQDARIPNISCEQILLYNHAIRRSKFTTANTILFKHAYERRRPFLGGLKIFKLRKETWSETCRPSKPRFSSYFYKATSLQSYHLFLYINHMMFYVHALIWCTPTVHSSWFSYILWSSNENP